MEIEKNDFNAQANILYNLGLATANMERHKEAVDYYKSSITICRDNKLNHTLSRNLTELGTLYNHLKEYKKAAEFLKQAESISVESDDAFQTAQVYLQLGLLYSGQNLIEKGIGYFDKSLIICKDNDYSLIYSTVLKFLAADEAKMGNTEKALKLYEKLTEHCDESKEKDFNKRLAEMQLVYETEAKEQEAEIFRLRNIDLEVKNQTISSQKKKLEKTLKKLKETEISYDYLNKQLKANIGTIIIGEKQSC